MFDLSLLEEPAMGHHWDNERNRFVADCEQHPDHQDVPWQHDHRFRLRRDPHTGRPKDAVVRAFWTGGFTELHSWPWDARGLAQAQAWCDEHHAVWEHSLCPVAPGDLAGHADPNGPEGTPR